MHYRSSVSYHLQPDFLTEAMETEEQTLNWLKFYDMDAPLVHVGEVVSADPEVCLVIQMSGILGYLSFSVHLALRNSKFLSLSFCYSLGSLLGHS